MSQPPYDPGQQSGQQPHQVPQPAPQVVYVQAPGPQVSRTRVGGSAHTVHLVLTVCTCGAWSPVWFLHWLFTRNKTVVR